MNVRREVAKKLLDEKVIKVGYLIASLFEKGKHYGVQKRYGSGLQGVTGECVEVDEFKVVIETSEFTGFDTEPKKHRHTFKTEEICHLWEVEQ